jgi:hypothetical protein
MTSGSGKHHNKLALPPLKTSNNAPSSQGTHINDEFPDAFVNYLEKVLLNIK